LEQVHLFVYGQKRAHDVFQYKYCSLARCRLRYGAILYPKTKLHPLHFISDELERNVWQCWKP
jgi:hypothetical protein